MAKYCRQGANLKECWNHTLHSAVAPRRTSSAHCKPPSWSNVMLLPPCSQVAIDSYPSVKTRNKHTLVRTSCSFLSSTKCYCKALKHGLPLWSPPPPLGRGGGVGMGAGAHLPAGWLMPMPVPTSHL